MLTDDESAELAELRRRAWGEDADILDDPTALARLEELEGKAHPPVPLVERARNERDETPQADLGDSARFDSLRSLNDPRAGVSPSLVERARNERDETPQDDLETSPRVDPRADVRPHRRRRAWLVAGGIVALVVVASVGGSILTSRPSASPTPSPTDIIPPVAAPVPAPTCGGGWGPEGTLDTPDDKPVWSRSFDEPPTSITVIPKHGGRVFAEWVNLDVRPNTIADVTVVKPTTARLFYTDVATWTRPPTQEQILADGLESVILPTCPNGDSYPGFILVPAPTCVTLEFTIDGTRHYTVNTAVGIDEGARCPAP
ncbi:hypothetical protein [Microbacterium candidum]|uniref:Uncharacterized protein n=1 Tax=Microbacterium candidum TaxID=3041922 RepID=A0ABT7MUM0_9MICO|nr:hypothetical protein [Microbacterium sp. ASV49]MDL9978139.1 hypothetical protein [Microbacterium sp. ASV49]